MSNRMFQTVISQMRDVVGRDVGIIDENGIIIACSEPARIGESRQRIREELSYAGEALVYENCTYRLMAPQSKIHTIIFVEGDDAEADKIARMLSISLGSIKSLYDEKYDKGSFIKNIILDNILPNDIYVKSNELRMSNDCTRIVMVLKVIGTVEDMSAYDMLQSMTEDSPTDYVISISEQDLVIVRELEEIPELEETEAYANKLIRLCEENHKVKLLVGVSSHVDKLKDLARAYKEARIAIEVGKVFDIERPFMAYENLGIGRLIYQLPTTLCDIFMQEVFKKGTLESLDRETLMTVQSFFENNLNVSETSRKLFVHRNTLVYRLEKIRKLTGLDLREFDHAVTFKVALMVKKYLTNKPTKF